MTGKDKHSHKKAPDKSSAGKQDELAEVQAERDDLLARLQRISADYLNYQKRIQRETADSRQYANEEIIKAMLSVLDDMERAIDAALENHGRDDPMLKGMQLVHDNTLEILGRFGLSVINAAGEPFDPQMHSALLQEACQEHPPHTVIRELQKGYQLKERTIRPSAVVISKAPEDNPQDDEQTRGN